MCDSGGLLGAEILGERSTAHRIHTHLQTPTLKYPSTGMTPSVWHAQSHQPLSLCWARPCIGFMLCCHHLEGVNHFLKQGSTFSFLLVPANQVAALARGVFCLSPSQCTELSGSLLNGRTSSGALSSVPLHQNLSSECLPDAWTYTL